MTSIVRKDNMIASDNRIILDITPERLVVLHSKHPKYFLLPNKQAIVAVSGSIDEREIFDKVLSGIYTALFNIANNQPLNAKTGLGGQPISVGHIGSLFVATKDFTISTCINNEEFHWSFYPLENPVIMGSGVSHVHQGHLFDKELTAADLIAKIYQTDELSGGTIYQFDLNQLEDFVVNTDEENK